MADTNATPAVAFNPIVVNGECIPREVIARELQYHPAASATEALQRASNALVIRSVLRQAAQQKGWDLDRDGEECAISELLKREARAPEAGDAECRRYFEANRAQFATSPLLELSHILLPAAPEDAAARHEQKNLALRLLTELQKEPGRFGELAQRYSACPSKSVQGSMGQIDKGQTVPEFERVVFALEPGLALHPVESRYGFHLVLIHRKVEGRPLSYAAVKNQIGRYLNEVSQRRAISQYLRTLVAAAQIEGFDPGVDGSPLMN